ncbi:glycosyltransferase [Aureimonas leprariae]|uniref:Glycosyltransferase n=1 Tax=Plantimonas leprariae TaxID=2615207 RepID=A0A7V7PQA2_9HYPH|nr:glycosyltransferase family 4 protein [Aureimonas leprariae]KAB0680291.1 glycosyltransferase [Aureimonas leprariae]
MTAKSILCCMQFVPIENGVGGSQRAWFLLRALSEAGEVDLVILHPDTGLRLSGEQETAIRRFARSVTVAGLPGWKRSAERSRLVHRRFGAWLDFLRMGSPNAPRLPLADLRSLAQGLPQRRYDVAFAARLPSAAIIDALSADGLVEIGRKVVDFDDVLSKFFVREAETLGWKRFDRKLAMTLDVKRMTDAEDRVLASWQAVSICSANDAAELSRRVPGARVAEVPNVIDRPLLAPATDGNFTILFVGNLGFKPNEQGLHRFLDEAWPIVRQRVPGVRLVVVGFDPKEALREKLARAGAELHSNVPSVVPYYEAAHAVIAPIFFGGGTRIKILEAMAFGRAVVSTPIGAEGLSVEDGRHLLVAGSMPDFAAALVRLAEDAGLRERLARDARRLQETTYGRAMMASAVRGMLEPDAAASSLAAN